MTEIASVGRFLRLPLEKLSERGPHHPPRRHDVRVDLADTLGSLAHRAQDYRFVPRSLTSEKIVVSERPPLDSGT